MEKSSSSRTTNNISTNAINLNVIEQEWQQAKWQFDALGIVTNDAVNSIKDTFQFCTQSDSHSKCQKSVSSFLNMQVQTKVTECQTGVENGRTKQHQNTTIKSFITRENNVQ